ncbi:AtpC F0F1-type ATP synthase, epsilon subunit (mitochondrial delta subunit) [Fimbriimonadaceae bacterium]
MAREFTLSVVSPDQSVVEQLVTSVVAPGTEGYFGIQAGHISLVAALKPGLLEYKANNQTGYIYIGGGFAEVRPDKMTVLADEASLAEELSVEKAEQMLEKARKELRSDSGTMTQSDAVQEVERAIQRLRAARLNAK